MAIYDLRLQSQHLPQLAQWHHAEWGHFNPGMTLDDRLTKMQMYLNAEAIPSTFVSISDSKDDAVQGSAAIVVNDMSTHPELTPWLASVFVAPEYRRRGIGSQLIRHVMRQAKQQGIDTLYLFTPDQAPLYASLGWQVIGHEAFHGSQVTLMKADLASMELTES